jgi:hypothetical protein
MKGQVPRSKAYARSRTQAVVIANESGLVMPGKGGN